MELRVKATRVQRDTEFEDDGLFALTLWVEQSPPHYISVSRDEADDPDLIYFEAEDQAYGFKTKSLNYRVEEGLLKLWLPASAPESFHWTADRLVAIEIPRSHLDEVTEVLPHIFNAVGTRTG